MTQHTPGPWRFHTAANGDNGIGADGTGIFAEVFSEIRHSGENAREEALANARLISAAPDLLAALRQALHCLEGNQHTPTGTARYERALAAIAKAEGAAA